MRMNFNILLMIFTQIALLIAFNIMNQVDWWMIVLLLTPLIILAIHFLLKKMLGKGLFFLEQTKNSAQMNYANLQNFNNNSTTNRVNKNAIAQVNSATNRFNNALQSVNAAADNLANAAANNTMTNNTMTNNTVTNNTMTNAANVL